MNAIKFLFIFFISSCLSSSVKLEPFSSKLLKNKNYQDESFSFSSEFKIVQWYKNQKVTEIKQFYYISDGHRIKGYVLLPKSKKLQKYPTLIHLRGGWGSFKKPSLYLFRWLNKFIEKGYVVFSSDLRGANGDDKHLDEFGGKDFQDVEKLFEIAKDFDFVDSSDLHTISWGSRGGVMSYLALKSKLKYKSSVIINGASDLYLLEKTRPAGFFSSISKDGKDNAYKSRSGIFWAEKIEKPVLIIHGGKNKNTSVEHAKTMAKRLRELNKKFKLKIYDTIGHDLSGADHVEQSLNWFSKHKL
ncbi:MAG: S9 family peptidase [Bacteriovoracaceae bacterium]|nr:S9 family peptidase [Bacteriovoracaceae bacterium]